jgi:prepilin peptidase CpaA
VELVQACAIGAASTAAITDLASRRIPNWLTFGTLIMGVLINAWLGGFGGVAGALGGAALGLAMLLPFYVAGAMGAGDVKLLAALGALLGPQLLFSAAVYMALAGGALSLVVLLQRGRLFFALNELVVQRRVPTPSGAKAPYGVAIACGVYLCFLLPNVLPNVVS